MSILNKKTHDVCLILDLGNASLAGSLTLFSPGLPPEALFTIRVPFTIGERAHPEKLQATLLSQLHDVLDTIHVKGFQHQYFKTHDKKIVKVLCVCASPWYVSRTKKVSVSNPKPFYITKAFLEDILTKEVEFFSRELTLGTHGDEFKSGVLVMEKTVVDAKINGYSLLDPVGQKTTSCDITLYLGVHSLEITKIVNDQILKFFAVGAQSILWHSFPLVAYRALQKIFPHESDYLLLDVTGEVTDITRIVGGVVHETVSFPSGKFFLIRKLMKTLSLPAEVAHSFLRLWQSKAASVEMEEKIKNAVVEAESEWSIYLEDALTSFGDIRALPQKIYITSDPDVASIFIDFLKTPHTDATMLWRRGVQIVHLSEELLSHFYKSGNHLTFDECVALDSIFLASFQ